MKFFGSNLDFRFIQKAMLSLISRICFLLGGQMYAAYQICERTKEFTTRIFPLIDKFLLLYCSINFFILVIQFGQKFLSSEPSLVTLYPSIVSFSSSIALL